MKDYYFIRETRCYIHQEMRRYPFDFIHMHFWGVPLTAAWVVCVNANHKRLENKNPLLGNGLLCSVYFLISTTLAMLYTRTSRWLLAAPVRAIVVIGCYQVNKDLHKHTL